MTPVGGGPRDATPGREMPLAKDLASVRMLRLLWPGALAVQAIHVAAVLGLADLVAAGPKTVDELARASSTHAPSLARLLRALTSLGIFVEDDQGHICQSELSGTLQSQHAGSLTGRAALLGAAFVWQAAGHLHEAVRAGTPAFEQAFGEPFFDYLAKHPDDEAAFHAGMPQRSGTPAEIAAAYDFSRCERVVDVGGGQGALLAAILAVNPEVTGILYDLPSVAEEAARAQHRWGTRFEVVGGNFLQSVPRGGDVYLVSHVLHNWNDEAAAAILRNCWNAMDASGRLVVVEAIWRPSREAARTFMDLFMMTLTGGRERSESELCRLVADAGFEVSAVIPTANALAIEARPRAPRVP